MKKILLFALVSAVLAAGCGSSSSHTFLPGRIALTWDIVDHAGGTLDCIDVDGVTLEVTAIPLQGGNTRVEQFDCDAFQGTTDSLNGGDYHVMIRLLDSRDQPLNTLTPSATFTIDGGTINVGNFVFQFTNI